MGKKTFVLLLIAISCVIFSVSVNAAPIVPSSGDWDVTITARPDLSYAGFLLGSPAPSTSVTDLAAPDDGVLLHYEGDSGGYGIGADVYQYDFETTASATGSFNLLLDFTFDGRGGWYWSYVQLSLLKNGSVYQVLDEFSDVYFSKEYSPVTLNITAGDTWGIRAISGNYDATAPTGVYGDIKVSSVPEPATLLLLGFGFLGLIGFRRKE